MVKLAHLLVLSCIIILLALSGCIGNDASKVKEAGKSSNYTVGSSDAFNGSSSSSSSGSSGSSSGASEGDLEVGLTQTEIKELDSDMSDLQGLLENSSVGEDIIIENADTGKSENLTKK
jgi:hypothetical protein